MAVSSLNTKVLLPAFFCKLITFKFKSFKKKNVVFDNFGDQKLFLKGKMLNNTFWHFSGEFHIESEILPVSSCHYPEFENGCHESKQQT